MNLSEEETAALSSFVELLADNHLEGKPSLLANCIYINLEKETVKTMEEIKKTFKD